MNKAIILGVVASVVIAGGIFIFSGGREKNPLIQEDEMMKQETGMEKSGDTTMERNDGEAMMEKKDEGAMMDRGDSMMRAGSYEVYGAEKITMAATGDVVLFFRASWCPTCRAVDADIKANLKDIPANLTILDVNYDSSSALKQKYGVTYQHTFVQVDAEGNQIKKWQGSPTLAALVAEVQ